VRYVALRDPRLRPFVYDTPPPQPEQIADRILRAMPGATRVCVPAGIGGHPDHLLVRQAGLVLASRGIPVRLYADMPYALRHGWPEWIEGDRPRRQDNAAAFWARALHGVPQLHDPLAQAVVVRLTPQERERKIMAVREYGTQVDSLNAGRTHGRLDREESFTYEVYWDLASAGAPRATRS
jgi:hypothetical protein